jgi:D-amino peptidase
MIEAGAYQSLQNLSAVKPYVPGSPVTITVEVDNVEKMADFKGRYGVELNMKAQRVYSRADNWLTAWDQIWHW